jgi:hypothetical protein
MILAFVVVLVVCLVLVAIMVSIAAVIAALTKVDSAVGAVGRPLWMIMFITALLSVLPWGLLGTFPPIASRVIPFWNSIAEGMKGAATATAGSGPSSTLQLSVELAPTKVVHDIASGKVTVTGTCPTGYGLQLTYTDATGKHYPLYGATNSAAVPPNATSVEARWITTDQSTATLWTPPTI